MKHYLNEKSENKSIISNTGESNAGYLGDIIREIGLSLSKSQEILDENWLESQRERLRVLLDNPDLVLPGSSSFVIPEANLDLAMEIKGKYDSAGNFKIQTKPHNAETISKSSVNQSVSSKVSLKFAMIPEESANEKKTITENISKLSGDKILELAGTEIEAYNELSSKADIKHTRLSARYIFESRKWHVNAFDGNENIALLIFDDTTGKFIGPILLLSPNYRTIENIDELSSPIILSVDKLQAISGDSIILTGENLGALNIQDTVVSVGGKKVSLLEVSFERINFKITPEIESGFIKIDTPEGSFKFHEELIIISSPISFIGDSGYGYYNLENNQGSLIKIRGENISQNTRLKFANGAISESINHTPTSAEFRVSSEARSGRASFLTGDYEVEMEQLFYLRPFIKNVSPKEARKNEMIRITGNHFSNIQRIKIGSEVFELSDEASGNKIQSIKSDRTLILKIPGKAGDGRLMVESHQKWWDSSVFFYQVSRIEKMPSHLIIGLESKIYGSGFGKTNQGLYLEFERNELSSIIECSYISDESEFAEQHIGFILKEGMFSDKVRIIRSDIADENNYEATTTLWKRKIPIFSKGTQNEDIIWCSSTWDELEKFWSLTNIDLTSKKVLRIRQEINKLKLRTELPVKFSFFAELYDIETLNLNLNLLDKNKQSVGNFQIKISPVQIRFILDENFNPSLEESISLNEVNVEKFERLLVRFYFADNEFFIQVNGTEQRIVLDENITVLKEIISKYSKITIATELSLDANIDAFISSAVISLNPTLSVPKYPLTDWDFEIGELNKEESKYVIEDLKKFPTTETKEFTIYGSGFTAYSTVVINEIKCLTTFDLANPNELSVIMPAQAANGELYVVDYLDNSIRSNSIAFKIIQGAKIISVTPRQVSSGGTIIIRGDHLTDNGFPEVYIEKFGPLICKEITDEVIEVLAPKLTLINGHINLKYGDIDLSTSKDLIDISSLNNYDILRDAYKAKWIVPRDIIYPTVLEFGSFADSQFGLGSVTKKNIVTLDDGKEYNDVLILSCPQSEYRYIEGRFEDFYIPKGSEFVFQFGFIEDARQTDGIKFSVFLELENQNFNIVDRIYRGYGEELSTFNIKTWEFHQKGTLVIRVEPGSSGYDDNLAIVKAEMQFTHIEDGWTWLFGSEQTNVLTIPGIQKEPDSNNMPGSRSFPAVWQDMQGQIWVFGGKGNDVNPRTGRLNDLWKFDGDNWTWMYGFISKNGFSKFSEVPGESTTPGARYASAYWQDDKGTFWLFGGHGYHESGRQRCLNDLWKYEDSAWSMVAISENWKDNGAHGMYGTDGVLIDDKKNEFTAKFWPLTRSHSSFWYDEKTKLLWMFGGEYKEPDLDFLISDLWTFDGETWKLMNGDGSENYEPDIKNERPSARCGAAIWTDERGDLWMFGGFGIIDGVTRVLNDLWKFRKKRKNKWEWDRMESSQLDLYDNFYREIGVPGPRAHASIWKDNKGAIWLFGGEGSNMDIDTKAPLNDLWKFENVSWNYIKGPIDERDMGDLSAPKIPYPDSWPSARFGCGTWNSPAGWLMMFGGRGYGESKTGKKSLGRIQQMWQFSPGIEND